MGYFIKRFTPIFLSVLIVASIVMFSLMTIGSTEEKRGGTLVEGSAPLGRYEDTIDITVGQMVSASSYVSGESASDNVMYDVCREVLNVNFKSVFSANIGTAYDYQLNTYILDGKVPDLFFSSKNQLSDLIEQGLVYDLTEVTKSTLLPR